jgi:hypothetical protein
VSDFLEVIPADSDRAEVQRVLDDLKEDDLEYVLVIGQDRNGGWYIAASDEDMNRAVHSVNAFRQLVMSQEY